MTEWRIHPAAALLPEMDQAEYAAFRLDVSENGIREPAKVYDGQIVDGRHRDRACKELGLELPTVPLVLPEGQSVTSYVLSANLFRRHLTTSQRAAVAAEAVPLFEAEASDRSKAGVAHSKRPPQPKSALWSGVGKSAAQAAAAVGVSTAIVEQARHVQKSNPEAFEQVKAGTLTVNAARTKTKAPPPPPVDPSPHAKDKLGREIADPAVADVFNDVRLDSIARQIGDAKKLVETVAASPVGAHLNVAECVNNLNRAAQELRAAQPYALCPYAPNCTTTSCKTCRQRGWITKRLHEQVPPEAR